VRRACAVAVVLPSLPFAVPPFRRVCSVLSLSLPLLSALSLCFAAAFPFLSFPFPFALRSCQPMPLRLRARADTVTADVYACTTHGEKRERHTRKRTVERCMGYAYRRNGGAMSHTVLSCTEWRNCLVPCFRTSCLLHTPPQRAHPVSRLGAYKESVNPRRFLPAFSP
jgi:hypothetical protein